jgi:tetratricopeptide (TPR) repeat protein
LVAVLVLGWRKRFLPYMTVILAFLAGLVLCVVSPGLAEVRIFMQILPLSLILLSERWLEYAGSGPAGGGSAGFTPAWAVRKSFPVLLPMTIMLIALSTGAAAWQYYIIFEDLQPDRQAQSELGKYDIADPGNLAIECQLLRSGYADAELKLAMISAGNQRFLDAINHYQRVLALDTNSVPALNNLAWLRATASDPQLRNGKEAVRLAERACQLTEYKEAFLVGTLAAAYAEAGRFDDAIVTAEKVRAMALAQGQTEIATRNEQLLELYESGQAYHQEAKPAP